MFFMKKVITLVNKTNYNYHERRNESAGGIGT